MVTVSTQNQVVTTNQNVKKNEKKENSFWENSLINTAAITGGIFCSSLTQPLISTATNYMGKYSRTLSESQVNEVINASENVLSKLTNLKQKGIDIVDMRVRPQKLTPLPDWLNNLIDPNPAIVEGKNALSGKDLMGNPRVFVNMEKLSLTTFHELGHAQNLNNSNFWSKMQKFRNPAMVIAGLIAMTPIFLKKEVAEEGKELTKGQKIKNAIRDYSPLAAIGAMLPVVAEETMASIRGVKWAKQLLSPDLANKVLKTNVVAGSTYILSALSMGVLAYGTKVIKDKLDEKQ